MPEITSMDTLVAAPEDGAVGKSGPSIFYAGDWNSSMDYVLNDEFRPYVSYTSGGVKRYYLRKGTDEHCINKNPYSDVAGVNQYWSYTEQQSLILARKIEAEEINVEDLEVKRLRTDTGNVIIDNDKLIAIGGSFNGYISFPFVARENSDAVSTSQGWLLNDNLNITSNDWYEKIVLPCDAKYNGSLVNIFNISFPPYTRTSLGYSTKVVTQNGLPFVETTNYLDVDTDYDAPTEISFIGCLYQFICVVVDTGYGTSIRWVHLNNVK